MEIQGILKNLREKNNLTQEQLAERVQVTRQAVSRWETGETQPNTDTLKLLSRVFDVSINTLLGSPRQLVCQCCGMPLNEDGLISREPDGSYNEDYCKWCYANGEFTYQSKEASVYKGYKRDKIEMRGDRAEMSDFPLYLNTVAGGLDCRNQAIGGFSFVVKIYALPVVEIIGQFLYLLGRYGFDAQIGYCF